MEGVDISVFHFDFDLTFAMLVMHPDGTIYHTFGGRDWTDPQSHLSIDALVDVLEKTVPEHEAYVQSPSPPKKERSRTVENLPAMRARIERGKKPKCFHCHMVHDAINEHLKKRKKWRREHIWIWPDPVEVGLRLGRTDQAVVKAVEPGSAAEKAGIAKGDRLIEVGAQPVRTFGDVQRALHEAPGSATRLSAVWLRGTEMKSGDMRLPSKWKEADPLVYSWRPSKWPLSPKPGFGGRALDAAAKRKLGLPEDEFAMRVGYCVTWGPNAYTGRNAQKAGIRKHDVLTGIGGKTDFHDEGHFQAWFRLTQQPGATIEMVRLRKGKKTRLKMDVLE